MLCLVFVLHEGGYEALVFLGPACSGLGAAFRRDALNSRRSGCALLTRGSGPLSFARFSFHFSPSRLAILCTQPLLLTLVKIASHGCTVGGGRVCSVHPTEVSAVGVGGAFVQCEVVEVDGAVVGGTESLD